MVYLHKGKYHAAQHQTEGIPGLTERGEMHKTDQGGREAGNIYDFSGDCALPNQHIDNIRKFDSKCSDIQPLGAALGTGAQRGAAGTLAEILSRTGTTLNMQPAVGTAKKMACTLMGAETIDQHGKSIILVVLDVSVYDPGMSDSLISAGRLMEAGYKVNFRIPNDALTDGFALASYSL